VVQCPTIGNTLNDIQNFPPHSPTPHGV